MTLAAQVALRTHRPYGRLLIDNREVLGFACRIRYSFGAVVALCELTLRERPDWLDFGQRVEVWLGYDGLSRRRFTGFVEDDGRSAWPHSRTITAAGYMRWTERKAPASVTYSSQSARTIIADLLTRAGVPYTSIAGDDTTLATLEDVVLAKNETYLSLIQQIDGPFLSRTFDWLPDGTVRRDTITQIPSATPKWVYIYPGNVLSIDNPLTIKGIKNRVEVTGLDGVTAYRRADSPYVATGFDEVHEVRSDLIETAGVAADVALLTMPTVNRLTREVTIRVAGNPTLDPGDTIQVDGSAVPSLGIGVENLWLKDIDDSFGADGYFTQLTLEGGQGESGYAIYPPRASFTIAATQERFDAGSGLTTYVTVICDGSASSSPTGAALTYAWTNNKTADVGTAATYSFRIAAADFATATVTLTVSDGSETDEATQSVSSASGGLQVRDLYVAMETDAASTPDGGVTWYSSTVNAVCTPEDAWGSASFFGVGTVLWHTADHLATAPTSIHTFPASITWIGTYALSEDRLIVGLSSGAVYCTTDAGSLGSATWTLYATRDAAINYVAWGFEGTKWDLSGRYTRANGSIQANLTLASGYTARRLVLAPEGHYAAGDNGSAVQVKRSDGTTLTFEAGHAPVRLGGLTHPMESDTVYAADETGKFYSKGPGSTEFLHRSTIGGGECFHLLADGTTTLVLWAACADGLYKSYDGGLTWYPMLTGKALMVGRGSVPWEQLSPTTVLSNDTDAICLNLWNGSSNDAEPADWKLASFDHSSWGATYVHASPPSGWLPNGAYGLWSDASQVPKQQVELCLFRQEFTLAPGMVSAATLVASHWGYCDGLWINGILVYSSAAGLAIDTVTLSTAIFVAGTNVIAVKHRTHYYGLNPGESWAAWRVDVS